MTISNTPGAPCWVDLLTADTATATAFYGDLFGWQLDDSNAEQFGGYSQFMHNGGPIAGLMPNDGSMGSPDAWTVYLETPDLAATSGRVREHAGQVLAEMQVADLGHMAVYVDPAGAVVGAWQPLEFHGISARAEVGAPAWFESLSTAYDTSVAFYRDVFDWVPRTMSDTPEFRYTTLGEDEAAMAGIMDASGFLGDQPSRWQFYVEVADTDATVAQAVATGGTLVMPVDETPFGRLAVLNDPEGVPFSVMGPNLPASKP